MNTVLSLLNFLNITDSYRDSSSYSSSYSYSGPKDKIKDRSSQYYTAINVYASKDIINYIDKSQQDSEYKYDDELYNYQLIQKKMLGDKPILLDRRPNIINTNISKTNISNYATSMKTPYEIHGDRVLINAQYYTFWMSIDAFNRLKK